MSNLESNTASDKFSDTESNPRPNTAEGSTAADTVSGESVPELWSIPDFSSLARAKKPLNSGHSQASSITNAAPEAEQLRQAEVQKGFERGFSEGMQAAQKQATERQRQFDEILGIFEAPLKQLDQLVASDLLLLATRLAEALVRQQVELDSRLLEPLVQDALSALEENHETAFIYLNPQDHGAVSAYLAERQTGELERQYASQYRGDLRFEISTELNRGDIQVKTKNARVDASLERRFRQIFEVLVNPDADLDSERLPNLAGSKLDVDSGTDSNSRPELTSGSPSQLAQEEARH